MSQPLERVRRVDLSLLQPSCHFFLAGGESAIFIEETTKLVNVECGIRRGGEETLAHEAIEGLTLLSLRLGVNAIIGGTSK